MEELSVIFFTQQNNSNFCNMMTPIKRNAFMILDSDDEGIFVEKNITGRNEATPPMTPLKRVPPVVIDLDSDVDEFGSGSPLSRRSPHPFYSRVQGESRH